MHLWARTRSKIVEKMGWNSPDTSEHLTGVPRESSKEDVSRMELSKSQRAICWVLQIVAAVILAQTLFFKFSGAKESIYIFTQVGAEPWGRIGSGVAELIASILLLVPRTAAIGAVMSMGIISGAIASHLFILGIALPAVGDNGELFTLAVVVFVCSAIVAFVRRGELPIIGPTLKRVGA